MRPSTYFDLIDPAIRMRRLLVVNEHRRLIVQTMKRLPDVGTKICAAMHLIRFYGRHSPPKDGDQ